MEMINVINNSNNPLPKYESEGAAGLDLRASFKYITPEIIGADSHSEPAPFAMESKPSVNPVLSC